MKSKKIYHKYKTALQKISDIKYASAVLQWDQETYLPKNGTAARGRQIATLNEMAHEHFTKKTFENILTELANATDLEETEKRNVALSLDDFNRNKKIPTAFVRKQSEAINKSFHAWIQARKENNFATFESCLHQLVELKKQEADLLGYQHHPYDALMNDYDKGLTTTTVDKLFDSLQPALIDLLKKIKNKPAIDTSFLNQYYNKDNQWKFGIEILNRMGFNFNSGRQDISEHPFTTNFCSQDVRLTTRIDEKDLSNMIWSCIHEGGHALYEQGLPETQYGMPLGEYCSLSIHESQSRLWENNVGRSLSFWKHNFSTLQTFFTKQLNTISETEFYNAINNVTPSLIRTEADEITYHFHIMIRYELEKKLIDGTIVAKDIPSYWNELYQKYLGIQPTDDKTGCLQDVHWSHGSFGYFATYSLGSLYAAQLYAAIESKNPSVNSEIAAGNNNSVLMWLNKNIHQYGRQYSSEELCKKATGENLNSQFFINYATKKYATIYQF
jgi:carboxypeptidase Taq